MKTARATSPRCPPALAEGETRNRFGFFGQINPYKGLDVVLQALHEIPKAERKKIVLEVHGANLEHQSPEFQAKIEELRRPLIKQGAVQWVGPYQPHELRSRMANVDWVVVPSIWWENSPMVIQEAFVCGRPLLVSNIGGMKEKIRPGTHGIQVEAGNISAWARAINQAAGTTGEWATLRTCIEKPNSNLAVSHLHLKQAPKHD